MPEGGGRNKTSEFTRHTGAADQSQTGVHLIEYL